VLLGLGPDGYTALLFPGTDAVCEQQRLVVAPWAETFHTYRVTLTLPVLNNAAHVIFLVSGEDKASTLQAVLEGDHAPARFPAQVIRPTHGSLLWLVDRAAASLLQTRYGQVSPGLWR
jgi:6-phosphogluconolactonase